MNKNIYYKLGSGFMKYRWFLLILLISLFVYLQFFSSSGKDALEKCADHIFAERYNRDLNYTEAQMIKDLGNKNLKIKTKMKSYVDCYSYCEDQRNRHPETFKIKYKR
jgi:gamma-glutamylcysteine synthetase